MATDLIWAAFEVFGLGSRLHACWLRSGLRTCGEGRGHAQLDGVQGAESLLIRVATVALAAMAAVSASIVIGGLPPVCVCVV